MLFRSNTQTHTLNGQLHNSFNVCVCVLRWGGVGVILLIGPLNPGNKMLYNTKKPVCKERLNQNTPIYLSSTQTGQTPVKQQL